MRNWEKERKKEMWVDVNRERKEKENYENQKIIIIKEKKKGWKNKEDIKQGFQAQSVSRAALKNEEKNII
jgi:hypothetical protein